MDHLDFGKPSPQKAFFLGSDRVESFVAVRSHTKKLCDNLEIEDFVVQPTQEVSPPKWHLAHTTWFFEEVILNRFLPEFERFNREFPLLFNSYYKSAGEHWLQGNRGNLSRPTVREIFEYRNFVDQKMICFLQSKFLDSEAADLVDIGLNHEQQHQELLLMDIKYLLGSQPSSPRYFDEALPEASEAPQSWKAFGESIYQVGSSGEEFAYDNEKPRHKTYIHAFAVGENLVSNGDYLKFVEAGGYGCSEHWLSDGWDWLVANSIEVPLYWRKIAGQWFEYSLYGLFPLDLKKPVCHISYYEADAYARWLGLRLPTEQELEVFLAGDKKSKSQEPHFYHPTDGSRETGELWCWTQSHYSPYPGFQSFKGMLGEYNGKFMCNQFVLKGGCVATPQNHYRNTYRNFYQPQQRWMFSGIRLAKDI